MPKSVLFLGGSGQAGSDTAALLRRWHPDLPFTIAGRDLDRARRVADRLGHADAVTVDLTRPDLGLGERAHSAVVATVWDSHLHGLGYAQDHGLPYLSISSGLVDTAPELVAGAHRGNPTPVLIASHYLAGLAVLVTLHAARAFDRVDSIRIGAVLDELDSGGPAGLADLERWAAAGTAGLERRDGVFTWIPDSPTEIHLDGVVFAAQTVGILDVPSLALATGAPNVRFDLAVGESPGRRAGGRPSTHLRIDLSGTDPAGRPGSSTHHLTHHDGQRPLTALGVALGVERMLTLRGTALPGGPHTPEALHDPEYAIERLAGLGAGFGPAEFSR
ncbi:saccharopine dehydrogenase [Nocardia sp. NPDC127579]|uniref:saccharopine dehydrogenase n=1 Tax=Nocardia sp. NPDC127579 TaxID=3345402 RepID=UPI00363E2F01